MTARELSLDVQASLASTGPVEPTLQPVRVFPLTRYVQLSHARIIKGTFKNHDA